jgi:citrate synthase
LLVRTLGHAFDWRADRLEWPVTTEVAPGLGGVIGAETRVLWLDPSSGQLAYRGYSIDTLSAEPDYEQVAFLLITGRLHTEAAEEFESFRAGLRSSRGLPSEVVQLVCGLATTTHPTRALRAGMSALGCHEPGLEQDLAGRRQWQELRVVGQVAALVAAIASHRRGGRPAPPDPGTSLPASVLAALSGKPQGTEELRVLNLLWVLYAAHGLDAPTFTSLVVASCLADPYYNLVAELSALRGPRVGGAAEAVLRQLLAHSGPEDAAAWVRRTLDEGGRIAGFGHPQYRMADPRAVILRKATAALARRKLRVELYEVARAVEEEATRGLAPRGVHINVNFYGALLFHLLGAEPELVPCLISAARVAGLAALVREALASIRLYRPLSRYVGHPERRLPPGAGS